MIRYLVALLAVADGFSYVGYLPEWRYEGANFVTLSEHLSHLILFSAEPTADGKITGLDRFPRQELLAEARAAATASGCKLMLCFGGNGRSSGFSAMVRNKYKRGKFVAATLELLRSTGADGVDINWEYPGYEFGRGYLAEAEVEKDYKGLALLVSELRAALGAGRPLTAAYYPDGRQEALFLKHGIHKDVDLMHAMTYDASGGHHSPMSLAQDAISKARSAGLPLEKVTIGLPFYGRSTASGDWTTYEDLVQRHHPLDPALDILPLPGGKATDSIGFNGRETIAAKTRFAVEQGAGGVMVWEAGQDCRMVAVTHGATTHKVTCPAGRESSLLVRPPRSLLTGHLPSPTHTLPTPYPFPYSGCYA